MTLDPLAVVEVELCDVTGLEGPGLVEIRREGLFFNTPDLATVGMSWAVLADLLEHPLVKEQLELEEDG